MRARPFGIKPNRLSIALFAVLALPVAGTAFAQDAADQQEEEQAAAAPAQASEDTTELDRVTVTGSRIKRSEEHTSELQSLMRISYAVFCLKKKKHNTIILTKQK